MDATRSPCVFVMVFCVHVITILTKMWKGKTCLWKCHAKSYKNVYDFNIVNDEVGSFYYNIIIRERTLMQNTFFLVGGIDKCFPST